MIRNPPIVALLVAEAVSSIGTRLTWLALPWFVLVTTGSPTRMGFVFAAELVPMALLGIPSGALVQRIGARQTMLVCDFARAPIVAAVPVLHHAGLLTYPLILGLTAAMGVFIAWLGAANVLWLDAATFLFAFGVLGLLVPRGRPAELAYSR